MGEIDVIEGSLFSRNVTSLQEYFRYGRLVEGEYVPATNTSIMSEPSICLPTAVSLLLPPMITQCACGIYVMAQEEIGGTNPIISHQFHSTQMGDMSQLVISAPHSGK